MVIQTMRVQNDGEAVLFQAFSSNQFRKVFHAEEIESGSDCGNFIELLFDQRACQELEGFGTGETDIREKNCDFRCAFLVVKMTFRERNEFTDILHQVRIMKHTFSEEIHEPLGSAAAPDIQKTSRHHLPDLFRIGRENIVRSGRMLGPCIIFCKIEFSCELHRCRKDLRRAYPAEYPTGAER